MQIAGTGGEVVGLLYLRTTREKSRRGKKKSKGELMVSRGDLTLERRVGQE